MKQRKIFQSTSRGKKVGMQAGYENCISNEEAISNLKSASDNEFVTQEAPFATSLMFCIWV